MKKKYTWPLSDYHLTTRSTLLLDGVKVRHDFQTADWDHSKQQLIPVSNTVSFDGQYCWSITTNRPTGFKDFATINNKEDTFRDAKMLALSPVFVGLRGREKGLAPYNPHDFRPTGRRQMIDGSISIECQIARYEHGGSRLIWITPDKDWQISRDYITNENGDDVRLDIRHSQNSEIGWTPAAWTITYLTNKQIACTWRYQVDVQEFNQDSGDAAFLPKIPMGIHVTDNTVSGGRTGEVLANGKFQPDNGNPAYYLPGEKRSNLRAYARYIAIGTAVAIMLSRSDAVS